MLLYFLFFRGMFSDGNFSYGIEPVGSGEVSQDFREEKPSREDQLVKLVVNTHISDYVASNQGSNKVV